MIVFTGEKYIKVIQVYAAEFFKVKSKFQVAIANMVSSKGFEAFEFLPKMNRLKKDLMDTLDANEDPDLSLARFEKLVSDPDADEEETRDSKSKGSESDSSSVPVDEKSSHDVLSIESLRHAERRERVLAQEEEDVSTHLDDESSEHSEHSDQEEEEESESTDDFKLMYKQIQSNYLIYVSMKKIVKGFIFTTIRCIQEYTEHTDIILPDEADLRLYNRTQVDDMFPESEMERLFNERKQWKTELDDVKAKAGGKSFIADLARQGKYNHFIALHVASGTLKDFDLKDTPEKVFKEKLLPLMGPVDHEQNNIV